MTSVLGAQGNGQKLKGRNQDNAGLDHNINRFESLDGIDVVNVGCLMCHAGSFNGELIIGLGSADADFTGGFGVGNSSTTGTGLSPTITGLLGLNEALATEGEQLFLENCAGCHGTYGANDDEDTYPNLIFPLETIGTDPVLAQGGVLHAPQMTEAYNQTYYGRTTPFVVDDPTVGYVAPPLDGVWATGPFLHNGSVPTIELVLDSVSRPAFWRRNDYDSKNFDQDALGWPYTALEAGQDQAASGDKKYIYDTTQFGQSNQGHVFGDHLTKDERRAVIEYLKTL